MPEILRVALEGIECAWKDVNHFLKHAVPQKLKVLYLGDIWLSLVSTKKYISSLVKAIQKTTHEVWLFHFDIGTEELQEIVKASANAHRLIIQYSKLPTDTSYDFSGPSSYSTKFISFYNCGKEHGNEWAAKLGRVKGIIKAVSKCGLKDSLAVFNIYEGGVPAADVKALFSRYGMHNVRVETTSLNPSTGQ